MTHGTHRHAAPGDGPAATRASYRPPQLRVLGASSADAKTIPDPTEITSVITGVDAGS